MSPLTTARARRILRPLYPLPLATSPARLSLRRGPAPARHTRTPATQTTPFPTEAHMPIIHRFTQHGQEAYFNGSPVKLAGGYAGTGDTSTTDKLVPPFDDDMQRLTQNENNFTRHIVTPYWNYSPTAIFNPDNCAFARQGDKWNIQAFNTGYFARLKGMIDTAANYGIVVQVVLFD